MLVGKSVGRQLLVSQNTAKNRRLVTVVACSGPGILRAVDHDERKERNLAPFVELS